MKPRVLLPDELRALPRLAIVFIECFDGEEWRPLPDIVAGMKCLNGCIVDEEGTTFYDFEKDIRPGALFDDSYFRFWDTMPTEEQRKAEPWGWDRS